MELLTHFIDIVLHLDVYLASLVTQYGLWIYAILFAIIFAETGLVVTPFLPGDSLLFVAGALAAVGGMDIGVLVFTLSVAAVLGNSTNYAIGRYLGPKVFQWPDSRFFNRRALQKTHEFYEKHGGKTLVMSRFLPLFRTFAPFVAGIGAMPWWRFTMFNVAGGVAWAASLSLLGYWFGNVPLIKNNLTVAIVAIIVISLIPAVIGWWKHRQSEG
jgi:membrane-associated protein